MLGVVDSAIFVIFFLPGVEGGMDKFLAFFLAGVEGGVESSESEGVDTKEPEGEWAGDTALFRPLLELGGCLWKVDDLESLGLLPLFPSFCLRRLGFITHREQLAHEYGPQTYYTTTFTRSKHIIILQCWYNNI